MDVQNILLITVFVINIFLSVFVYFHKSNEDKLNSIFALLSLNVSIWVISMFFYRQASSTRDIGFFLKTLYAVPIFIPVLFLYFSIIFTKVKLKIDRNVIKESLFLISAIIAYSAIFTNSFVIEAKMQPIGEKFILFGDLYWLYVVYFISFFSLAFVFLLKEYFLTRDEHMKVRIKYVFLGTSISSILGMMTNLILPWFGFFGLNWLGNVLTVFFIGFITYAIIKYKLLDVKTFTAELLILLIIIASLVQMLLAQSVFEVIITSSVLILVAIFGFLLVRGIYNEVKTREKIEVLAFDISTANKKLRQLEKQKSEFVSIASHQLRTPLTAIKGYASMLIEGSFGRLSPKLKDAIEKIYRSSQALVITVDDFLIISRIEEGRMHYELEYVSVTSVIKEVLNDVSALAKEKNIEIKTFADYTSEFNIYADRAKIKQVFNNIVNNALNYTEKGHINITISKDKERQKIKVSISDTGRGLEEKEILGLFKKFNELKDDKLSSGIGLYVANEIIKAHRGQVWVESAGLGKGATFFIELPEK